MAFDVDLFFFFFFFFYYFPFLLLLTFFAILQSIILDVHKLYRIFYDMMNRAKLAIKRSLEKTLCKI